MVVISRCQVHPDTHPVTTVNNGVVNYVIAARPSLRNFMIAHSHLQAPARCRHFDEDVDPAELVDGRSTIAATSARHATSASTARTRRPICRTERDSSSTISAVAPWWFSTMSAPAPASIPATARPMPWLPPVRSATCRSSLVASPGRSAWIVPVATACSPPAARGSVAMMALISGGCARPYAPFRSAPAPADTTTAPADPDPRRRLGQRLYPRVRPVARKALSTPGVTRAGWGLATDWL